MPVELACGPVRMLLFPDRGLLFSCGDFVSGAFVLQFIKLGVLPAHVPAANVLELLPLAASVPPSAAAWVPALLRFCSKPTHPPSSPPSPQSPPPVASLVGVLES